MGRGCSRTRSTCSRRSCLNAQLIVGLGLTIASALRFAAIQTPGRFFTYLPHARNPCYTSRYVGIFLTVSVPRSVLYGCLGTDPTRKLMAVLALAIAHGTQWFYQVLGKSRVVRYKFTFEHRCMCVGVSVHSGITTTSMVRN